MILNIVFSLVETAGTSVRVSLLPDCIIYAYFTFMEKNKDDCVCRGNRCLASGDSF